MPSPRKPDQAAPNPVGPAGASPNGSGAADAQAQSGAFLKTAQGLRLPDTDHSLKAGERGPTLLKDFHLRRRSPHFGHERIPEIHHSPTRLRAAPTDSYSSLEST